MKTLMTMLLCSSIFFISCNKETIRGSGPINTEVRTVPAFTSLEVGGSADVTIVYGTTQHLSVTGYQNLLPVYETTVSGNTLYLKFRDDIYNVRNNNIKVAVTLPLLTYMRINGSGKINANNFLNADVLTAAINGSGIIYIGSSSYNKASYSINGSGDIKASTTPAVETIAQISGSGSIELNVSSKLKTTISGSGNISYWGNPGSVDTQVNGSGKITKK